MKKNLTLTSMLMLLMTATIWAQNNEVKIEISKNVDGKQQTFKRTYESEEAMQNDEELKEFMGDENQIHFWTGDEDAISIPSFHFGDDEEGGHSFVFFSDDDSTFSKQFNLQMEEMSKHINIGIASQLQDMQQNMIIDLNKNGNFAYAFGDSIDENMMIKLKNLKVVNGEDAQTIQIMIHKSINISDDTSEFGKKGKVSETNQLTLENLSYYPNPATNGRFKLKFDVPEVSELSIKIYNLDGKEILGRYFDAFDGTYSETIDLSGQSEGIYLLEIEKNGKRLTRKIAIN